MSYDVVAPMTSPGDPTGCNITLVGDVQLQCFAPTNFTVEADESFESYVVFTRLGGLTAGEPLVAAD